MVALLALAAIAGGMLTSLLAFPALGFWALLLAPLGGSAAVLATGAAAAGEAARQRSREEAIDEMVAGLRSVLPRTDAVPATGIDAGEDASPDRRRHAG